MPRERRARRRARATLTTAGGLDVGRDALLVVAEDRVDAVGARLAIGAGAREAVLERAAAHVDVDARVEHEVDAARRGPAP